MCYTCRVALRIRASSATVGARHASPVKYAVGVFSVNPLFTQCHEIIARNANNTRYNRAGEARQCTYEMLFNVYAYCDAIIFGMLCRFGRIRFRPYRIGIQ